MSLIFLVNGPCLTDNSPEWFTQTICSIERKMPYTNAIWGVLLEKNYWIYDLNFEKRIGKKMCWKIRYYVQFILLEMFDYDLEGTRTIDE